MDLDEYIKQIQSDLDRQLKQIRREGERWDFSLADGTTVVGKDFPMEANACDDNGKPRKHGVILTNTDVLAMKYGCSSAAIMEIIQRFMSASMRLGIFWELCDVASGAYEQILDQDCEWTGYVKVLDEFIHDHSVATGIHTGLFIVGGEDVIPMPKVSNPLNSDESLDVDLMYSFPTCTSPSAVFEGVPRFIVGRLPLEDSDIDMHTSAEDDLGGYFERSNSDFIKGGRYGLEIKNALMTTTESWVPSSEEMMSKLPKPHLSGEPRMVKDGMYLSPVVDSSAQEVMEKYLPSVEMSDMLVFNLHGSDQKGASSYYGEDKSCCLHPEAFTIDMLKRHSRAKILNTTACYGARFTGYTRDDSMLLNAIYSHADLFCGSCVSALGRGNGFDEATDLLQPAGMSELFMKLYSIYLCQGRDAGEAFLSAKQDYYSTCHQTDGDDCALATILMFNLYGNPLLHVRQLIKRASEQKSIPAPFISSTFDFPQKKVIYKKGDGAKGFLEEVQSKVDANFSRIRVQIERDLEQNFHLPSRDLSVVEKFSTHRKQGYQLSYAHRHGHVNTQVMVRTDLDGSVLDVIHYK